MGDEWRTVNGFGGTVQVNRDGELRRFRLGKWRAMMPDCADPSMIRFYVNGKRYSMSIARLVYSAFCGEIPEGERVTHINGIKADCRAENLRLCTLEDFRRIGTRARSKAVCKINEKGEILELYASAGEAAAANHLDQSTVARQCRGETKNPFERGYFAFAYADDMSEGFKGKRKGLMMEGGRLCWKAKAKNRCV